MDKRIPQTRGEKAVYPFADDGNYIAMHQVLFDAIMPNLSPAAWKLLCFIIRKTIGWQKEWDQISNTQISKEAGKGLGSRTTIGSASDELVSMKIIEVREARKPDGTKDSNWFSLNKEFNISIPCSKIGHG